MTAEELAREVTPVPELETPCAAYEADADAFAALSCGRPVALSALTRLSFGAEPRPDSPAVIKSPFVRRGAAARFSRSDKIK